MKRTHEPHDAPTAFVVGLLFGCALGASIVLGYVC